MSMCQEVLRAVRSLKNSLELFVTVIGSTREEDTDSTEALHDCKVNEVFLGCKKICSMIISLETTI